MQEERITFKLTNEEGKEVEYEVLFTFESNETGKNYISYTDNEIDTAFTGGYNETDNVGIITKVENERDLIEINGKGALKQYSTWIGVDPKELTGKNAKTLSNNAKKPWRLFSEAFAFSEIALTLLSSNAIMPVMKCPAKEFSI